MLGGTAGHITGRQEAGWATGSWESPSRPQSPPHRFLNLREIFVTRPDAPGRPRLAVRSQEDRAVVMMGTCLVLPNEGTPLHEGTARPVTL